MSIQWSRDESVGHSSSPPIESQSQDFMYNESWTAAVAEALRLRCKKESSLEFVCFSPRLWKLYLWNFCFTYIVVMSCLFSTCSYSSNVSNLRPVHESGVSPKCGERARRVHVHPLEAQHEIARIVLFRCYAIKHTTQHLLNMRNS